MPIFNPTQKSFCTLKTVDRDLAIASAVDGSVKQGSLPRAAGPGFTLENVTFRADGRELLVPLSLGLPRGRFHGLVGHNGSGKSTLLKILARQQAPSSGMVQLEGRPLARWGGRELARRIAYLPQSPAAGHGLTVLELVRFGRYPWHGPFGRAGATDQRAVEEALALCHVESFADRLVDSLSGGERQRAWIAMLVAQQADVVLLDEPISALDLGHQIEVLRLLQNLARRGAGVVAVLHDINMTARFCDEILALRQGRLVARGTPGDLMTEPTLETIFGIPMRLTSNPAGGPPLGIAR